jgi:hypothetical protein
MDRILMKDVVPLLPLPQPPRGKSSYYAPCPNCDSGRGREKHLNISFAKNVFRCPRCGWNGGIFDLYAYYTNTPRGKVRDELMRILKKENPDSPAMPQARPIAPDSAEPDELQAADVGTRHDVYDAMLSMLSLAPDHKENLLGRGLSEQTVAGNCYKTTPMVGGRVIAKRLIEAGLHLKGVPGFYIDNNGSWNLAPLRRGIMIPVRDGNRRIQGVQIRRDNVARRKYRWLSSADIEGGTSGCRAEGWMHIAGPARDRIILIEGPMKADIVHHLTGQTVLAIPGVNSLKHLEKVLLELKAGGLVHIMTAFDMDFLANPHVKKAYDELANLFGQTGLRYGTYLWRPDYKGLDDYILKCCLGGS